jgi:transposase-like protein
MNGKLYTDEFKIEVAKQITEQGHKVNDVASRLNVNPSSIYNWIKKYKISLFINRLKNGGGGNRIIAIAL